MATKKKTESIPVLTRRNTLEIPMTSVIEILNLHIKELGFEGVTIGSQDLKAMVPTPSKKRRNYRIGDSMVDDYGNFVGYFDGTNAPGQTNLDVEHLRISWSG